MQKNQLKQKRVLAIAIVVFILALLVTAFNHNLTIRKYTVITPKLHEGSSIRIVLLADLHSCIYGKEQRDLIAKIKNQNPDLILMAGDIADDETPIDATTMLLEGIANLAPCYYVTGNHEFWSGNVGAIKELFKSYGVRVLEQDTHSITLGHNRIHLSGVDDPDGLDSDQRKHYGSLFEPFGSLSASEVNILLAHRPEYMHEYAKYPFDLVVSGHTHGGQWRIPWLLNGLYAPNQGPFPRYAGGLYKHGGLTHIVSRGLCYNPRLPRIFNPPEIVVIELNAEG